MDCSEGTQWWLREAEVLRLGDGDEGGLEGAM